MGGRPVVIDADDATLEDAEEILGGVAVVAVAGPNSAGKWYRIDLSMFTVGAN
jgi:hypothetical protein